MRASRAGSKPSFSAAAVRMIVTPQRLAPQLSLERGHGADPAVHEAVGLSLLRREPAVAVGLLLDPLDELTGVPRDQGLHVVLGVDHLLGLDGDIGRRAADAAVRL